MQGNRSVAFEASQYHVLVGRRPEHASGRNNRRRAVCCSAEDVEPLEGVATVCGQRLDLQVGACLIPLGRCQGDHPCSCYRKGGQRQNEKPMGSECMQIPNRAPRLRGAETRCHPGSIQLNRPSSRADIDLRTITRQQREPRVARSGLQAPWRAPPLTAAAR